MEDEASSMLSNVKFNEAAAAAAAAEETADSGHSNYLLRGTKRARHENVNASLARFKGVVPQQNGHWGAQIYANHQRIWLGTFKCEREAAMAYDSAAIKLRSGDSHRNFPWTDQNILEPNFQNLYTTEDLLNMIRDGTYQAKLAEFLNILSKSKDGINNMKGQITVGKDLVLHGDIQFSCKHLFQKELTPSDVGKLNRFVIPKKYAVKYLPYICENDEENYGSINGGGVEDMELVFYDKSLRTWKFRYCYWRSSQSYVFTRGWNRFVKDKKLREKDIITFYTSESPAAGGGEHLDGQNFFMIDVNYRNSGEQSNCINIEEQLVSNRLKYPSKKHRVELELSLGKNFHCRMENIGNSSQFDEDKALISDNHNALKRSHNVEEKRSITLFGVQIN